MKYGLLVTRPINSYKNIGDYVQSLAARQFIPGDYCIINKEEVGLFHASYPVKTVMNAWYMWHPENWPPSKSITPLLVSIHISPLTADKMLSDEGQKYLKEYGPVGCRDTDTQAILEKVGVPCYFSACLTLTLGQNYKYDGERHGIIFADPFIPSLKYIVNQKKKKYYPLNLLKALYFYLGNHRIVNELIKRHEYFHSRFKLVTLYNASMFYHIYSSRFNDDVLLDAEYVHHIIPVDSDDNDQTLLEKAENLIIKYSMAQYVITSRIHCALPCIGLETPLVFVMATDMKSRDNMFNAPGRFGGLIDFFRTLCVLNGKLVTEDSELQNCQMFTKQSIFSNKTTWVSYKNKLVEQCSKFFEL